MKRFLIAAPCLALLVVFGGTLIMVRAQSLGQGQAQTFRVDPPSFSAPPVNGNSNSTFAAPQLTPYGAPTPADYAPTPAAAYAPTTRGANAISQDRLLQLNKRMVALLNSEGLKEEIARTEKRIAELEAEHAVRKASEILKAVLSKYPSTQAAGSARKMLGEPAKRSPVEEASVDKATFEETTPEESRTGTPARP